MSNPNPGTITVPPTIAEVATDIKRPMWSVMIPTFNCANYLRQTLESVLDQYLNPAHMQIEVVDDCSTRDDPEAVVHEVGKGKVTFYRKAKNGGAIANFNTCIERSRGHLVHILHGDDWVEPGFYSQMQEVFEKQKDVGICISRVFIVDENGELESLSPRILIRENCRHQFDFFCGKNPVRTPGVVVRRKKYEALGGFLPMLLHTADWEMWFRILCSSKGVFINRPLANYRSFSDSDTWRLARTGENLRDYIRLAKVLQHHDRYFDSERLLHSVIQAALMQSRHFEESGDIVGREQNVILYRELMAVQPLKKRCFEAIRRAKPTLAKWINRIAERIENA